MENLRMHCTLKKQIPALMRQLNNDKQSFLVYTSAIEETVRLDRTEA